MIQLSGLDAMFVHLEMRGLPMHISSFSIYDPASSANGCLDFPKIREIFNTAVIQNVPILRCRLQKVSMNLDQPYWVEDKQFNVNLHVHHIALPQPADWATLREVIADLHAAPLSRDKPLWEAYVIENLSGIGHLPKGSFGVFLKVHHAIMDGRTGLKIFTNLHSLMADEAPISFAHPQQITAAEAELDNIENYSKPSLRDSWSRGVANNWKRTKKMADLFARRLPVTALNVQKGLQNHEIKHIPLKQKTCFNNVISQRRVIDCIRVPLADMQKMRGLAPGSTLNDVALTIIGGGLRRYLSAQQQLPEESLVATLPIDVRQKCDSNKSGNMLSIMNVPLCSDVEDPVARLNNMLEETRLAKRYTNTLGKDLLTTFADNMYTGLMAWGTAPFIESGLFDKLPVVANTVVSNVPGTPIPLYMGGAKLVESFGMGPLLPTAGLFHTVTSTCDWMSISFVSCPEAMKDIDLYKQCLLDSFEELRGLTEAGQKKASSRKKSSNTTVEKRKAKRKSTPKPLSVDVVASSSPAPGAELAGSQNQQAHAKQQPHSKQLNERPVSNNNQVHSKQVHDTPPESRNVLSKVG